LTHHLCWSVQCITYKPRTHHQCYKPRTHHQCGDQKIKKIEIWGRGGTHFFQLVSTKKKTPNKQHTTMPKKLINPKTLQNHLKNKKSTEKKFKENSIYIFKLIYRKKIIIIKLIH
jgi:ATP-dependent Zn protease